MANCKQNICWRQLSVNKAMFVHPMPVSCPNSVHKVFSKYWHGIPEPSNCLNLTKPSSKSLTPLLHNYVHFKPTHLSFSEFPLPTDLEFTQSKIMLKFSPSLFKIFHGATLNASYLNFHELHLHIQRDFWGNAGFSSEQENDEKNRARWFLLPRLVGMTNA